MTTKLFYTIAYTSVLALSLMCTACADDTDEATTEDGGEVCSDPAGCDNTSNTTNPAPCDGVVCPTGEMCQEGTCVAAPGPCGDVSCPDGEVCEEGVCVAVADPCDDVSCPDGEVCEEGVCIAMDPCEGVMCPEGEACEDGACVAMDPCEGVMCPEGEACEDGACVAMDPCEGVMCPEGEACEEGVCIALDPCDGVRCAEGEVCEAGECVSNEPATLMAQVRLARDYANQIDDNYRAALTAGSKMGRGVLYVQLCEDAACEQVIVTRQANEMYLYSTGFTTDISVELPPGEGFVRFILDTEYSQERGGSWDDYSGISPLDMLQSAGMDPRPSPGFNPPAEARPVALEPAQESDFGEVVIGTLTVDKPVAPRVEAGVVLAAASGNGVFRNSIKAVDVETYTDIDDAIPSLDGAPFPGDLCGFVEGDAQTLYAVGVGAQGAYVYAYSKESRTFLSDTPAWIPHPECNEGVCPDALSANLYPFPCEGVVHQVGPRRLLYLIELKGAGTLQTTQGYQLTVVDVTDLATGGDAPVVALYEAGDHGFITNNRIFRRIAIIGNTLYLLEPSWSQQLRQEAGDAQALTTIHSVPLGPDGLPNFDQVNAWETGPAEETCGGTSNWVPGLTITYLEGQPRLLVGNDDDIAIFEPSGATVGTIDVRSYGSLPASFTHSPDRRTLYALPNCKSTTTQSHVQLGLGDDRTTLDRHAIMVLDLTQGAMPELLYTDRDFDQDGTPDGGIDLEFLHHKRDLLRWCAGCTGSVPPTVYTAPEIVVGDASIFLRGTGIEGADVSSSGLGQVGDLGVYDLESGEGVLFRDHSLWLDGPSARWGFDLDPSNPINDFSGDVSVAALYFLPNVLPEPPSCAEVTCLEGQVCEQGRCETIPPECPEGRSGDGCTLCTGDLDISSAAELDAIAGCAIIDGSLQIADSGDISDLTALRGLIELEGPLSIRNNSALISLDGLGGLTSAVQVDLTNNDNLLDLTGLSALATVRGDLSINDNDSLLALTGLAALTSIGGTLSILDNDQLSGCAINALLDAVTYADVNVSEQVCVPPPTSCLDLRDNAREPLPSGEYTIDPDGEGAEPPFTVYCDMETDGGGWTLALNMGSGFDSATQGQSDTGCYDSDCVNRAYSTVPLTQDIILDASETPIAGENQPVRTLITGVHEATRGQTLQTLMTTARADDDGPAGWFLEAEDNSNLTNQFADGLDCSNHPWSGPADYGSMICRNRVITLYDPSGSNGPPYFAIGASEDYSQNQNNIAGWPQNALFHYPDHFRVWVR